MSRAEADKESGPGAWPTPCFFSPSLGPPGFIARGVASDGKTPYPHGLERPDGFVVLRALAVPCARAWERLRTASPSASSVAG